MQKDIKVAVIGLGYVGLPLAVEFGKKYQTIGFDINHCRVKQLRSAVDATQELSSEELKASRCLLFSTEVNDLKRANTFIITVPTPIDTNHQPDLVPLQEASKLIGQVIKKDDVVIYESTVYPGATEEHCIPVIEEVSGLSFNKDFYAGYSPERINPGDKTRKVSTIVKVTSGSTPEIADYVDELYKSIITAGTHKASSIKVAEASKIIENVQRDVNIALINEFAMIFSHLDIDTHEVVEAASSKWNFMKLTPGLVGGHCIGVDPYYLLHKSVSAGYIPDMLRAAREINDGMAKHVVSRLVKTMIDKNLAIKNARVLVLGFTFKEDCNDTRNTKIVDLAQELRSYGMKPDLYDPWVSAETIRRDYGCEMIESPEKDAYDVLILAVPHKLFKEMGLENMKAFAKAEHVFYDLKSVFAKEESDLRL